MSKRGVINPYTAHVHPYPTRYHGGMYARPVFDLPYKRNPHAVFKPNDFYTFYGVKGLGSFGGSSLGNGSIGGNTLGLGATGAPIYWMASATNPKVTALQQGINKILVAHGYSPIPVTGRLEGRTCGALGLLARDHREELLTQIPNDIVNEAANTCTAAVRQGGQLVVPGVEGFQQSINKVLVANGYLPIPVTGRFDGRTCGALVLLARDHREDLLTQIPQDIVNSATNTCMEVARNGESLIPPSRNPNHQNQTAPAPQPVPVAQPEPEPAPVVVQPEIYEPEPEPTIPEGPEPTYITISEDMPEMQVEARPAAQTAGKSGLWVLAALGGAGILYFALRKKKA